MVRDVFKEFCLPALADGKLADSSCTRGKGGRTTLLHATGKLEDFGGAAPQIKEDPPMMEGPVIDTPNNHEKEPAFSEDEETEEEDDDDIPLGEPVMHCCNYALGLAIHFHMFM
jgi:hypothetical protein